MEAAKCDGVLGVSRRRCLRISKRRSLLRERRVRGAGMVERGRI